MRQSARDIAQGILVRGVAANWKFRTTTPVLRELKLRGDLVRIGAPPLTIKSRNIGQGVHECWYVELPKGEEGYR